MLRLLNQCVARYPGETLVFLGDLIDRGPNSREVVRFAMDNHIPTVMGNHEHLALAYHGLAPWRGFYGHQQIWLANGGDVCLASFERDGTKVLRAETIEDGIIVPEKVYVGPDTKLPKDVLDWMKGLPYYLSFRDDPTVPRDEKRNWLLLSHTGYGLEADQSDDGWFTALWRRDDGFRPDGAFRVFGHTPSKEPVIRDHFACIDTGAAYKGYHTMTAFHWPSKAVVQQAFDETPVEPTFTMVDGCLTPR
jgi:serine/threonine protein phosphatase 1